MEQYWLILSWKIENLSFNAIYSNKNKLYGVTMCDPHDKAWYEVKTKADIGKVLTGEARAAKIAQLEGSRWD